MKPMTDHEIGQAMRLARGLLAEDGDRMRIAILAASMLSELGYGSMTAFEIKEIVRLAGRIVYEMPSAGQRRFSLHDYADAVVNAGSQVSFAKLLILDDESFAAAMIRLAADRRKACSGQEPIREPPDLDIYMNG